MRMTDSMERNPNLLGAERAPDFSLEPQESAAQEVQQSVELGASVDAQPAPKPIEVPQELPQAVPQTLQDPLIEKIEAAMTKGSIMKVYETLPEDQQQAFRAAGELAARELRGVIGTKRFVYHKTLGIIRKWMHSLRGKDRAYLEQQANIIYGRVARMHEEQRNSSVAM
ncbi:MAG: hypothetical protein UY72_C0030G0004 [Candidatus Uhrbacteria bacterium GW2011_GWD2_52_7]|uniref:Uncharacterized protein n=1 Tax=Candidatus Uhrbacteria bacterium GW2011_GWD2_52_7 TaxID=1618989 RepID=A0A0G1XG05_9BACT|nr:MAG: hypothetical protein UY72_C0030G0004 [Candidatus Uhrbacteria bacterium GW2011_GWD2_52_7]